MPPPPPNPRHSSSLHTTIPTTVAWLGYGGLIPFVLLAAAAGGGSGGGGVGTGGIGPGVSSRVGGMGADLGAGGDGGSYVRAVRFFDPLLAHGTQALFAYGAVILSFVGALHWAFAMTLRDLPAPRRNAAFLWSVVPALLAWAALMLALVPSAAPPTAAAAAAPAAAAALMVLGFLAQYRRDVGLARESALPAWYLPLRLRLTTVACVCIALGGVAGQGWIAAARAAPTPYLQEPASEDGIGKIYEGREIARVMGFAGAAWLDRPDREREERPDILVDDLGLEPGMTVADIGAGSGYLSRRLAPRVAPGRVIAVDVQLEMVALLQNLAGRPGMGNIMPEQGAPDDVKLPAGSVDLAVMVDVYHELEFPFEIMQSIVRALKPGGRMVFVEYRAEDPKLPIKALHKMSEAQVRREMGRLPLTWERTDERLPLQHLIVFRKAPH